MGINNVTVYTMTCDRCGKGLYPDEDMIYHEGIGSLIFVACESQWDKRDGKWLCPDCQELFKD